MEIRRYKDIVAFKAANQLPVAFHSKNMEVAELSNELWQTIAPAQFSSTSFQDLTAGDELTAELTNELKDWESSENPEVISKPIKFGIRSLTVNVTQICNLHCTYCAAGGDGTYGDAIKKISVEKTLPQIQFFLDQLPMNSSFHISFLGGEPLLYPEAMKAIAVYTRDAATKKNTTVTFKVTTNGTLLTDKNIQILNDIGCAVVVSLDGPKEINDQRRPNKAGRGSSDVILAGIERLSLNRKQIPTLEVHAVMDPGHADVDATYEFFRTLPVDRFEFTFSVSDSNEESSKGYVTSYEKAIARAYQIGGEKELRRFTLLDRYFDTLDNQYRVENHCGLGKTLAVVDARNRLFNCPWTVGDKTNQLGNQTDLNYENIAKYQMTLVEMNKCGDCWARFLCGGGCSFVHGSVNGTDLNKKNDFCFRTRYLSALALRYFSLIRGTNGKEEGEPNEEKAH